LLDEAKDKAFSFYLFYILSLYAYLSSSNNIITLLFRLLKW